MIWVAGRSPTLVSQNLKATTLTYLAISFLNARIGQVPESLPDAFVLAILGGQSLRH